MELLNTQYNKNIIHLVDLYHYVINSEELLPFYITNRFMELRFILEEKGITFTEEQFNKCKEIRRTNKIIYYDKEGNEYCH